LHNNYLDMQSILDPIQQFFLLESGVRALIASVLVGGLCGLLGSFIVLRNMSLIGDALSHAILPGIVVAFVFFGYSTSAFFGGSVLAGIIAALLITWLQRSIRIKNDAAIGIIFTFMFSIGVIGISWLSHHDGVHLDLKDFLFGNILAVQNEDVWMTLGMCVIVSGAILIFYRAMFTTTFQADLASTLGYHQDMIHYLIMLLLSLSVVASLRSVGVILVVAMLITPASAALLISDRLPRVLATSSILGMIAALTGLLLSISIDTPPGPSMAVVTTLIYLLVMLFAPQRGLIIRWRVRKQQQMRVVVEDILKQLYRIENNQPIPYQKLEDTMVHDRKLLTKWIRKMAQLKLIKFESGEIQLTESGKQKANHLVRAHRLWETFLVEELGLKPDQIHEEAERFEHHLSEEEINEVDRNLGYPKTDPHGSPIPR
jgi:ABC-type Mn2+/Zn2+ transport system permease subunit/Mn-dependent DtxR family transcriptional regulator